MLLGNCLCVGSCFCAGALFGIVSHYFFESIKNQGETKPLLELTKMEPV